MAFLPNPWNWISRVSTMSWRNVTRPRGFAKRVVVDGEESVWPFGGFVVCSGSLGEVGGDM